MLFFIQCVVQGILSENFFFFFQLYLTQKNYIKKNVSCLKMYVIFYSNFLQFVIKRTKIPPHKQVFYKF